MVDGSKLRRGKVAAHLIWGGAASVLVGDFLFARAFELMVETGRLQALNILARASRIIAEGEVLQLTRAHDLELDQATYLEIIRGKTAELFAAAAEAGAVVSGGSAAQVKALAAYGLQLGLAFQLTDDALDYGGASETLGKNAGDDFREGKVTLPRTTPMRPRRNCASSRPASGAPRLRPWRTSPWSGRPSACLQREPRRNSPNVRHRPRTTTKPRISRSSTRRSICAPP